MRIDRHALSRFAVATAAAAALALLAPDGAYAQAGGPPGGGGRPGGGHHGGGHPGGGQPGGGQPGGGQPGGHPGGRPGGRRPHHPPPPPQQVIQLLDAIVKAFDADANDEIDRAEGRALLQAVRAQSQAAGFAGTGPAADEIKQLLEFVDQNNPRGANQKIDPGEARLVGIWLMHAIREYNKP